MIRFRNRGALFGECWFDGEPPPRNCDVDVVAYRQQPAPIPGAYSTTGLTLVHDLTVPQDAILESYGKTSRQEIQRAHNRDELELEFVTEPQDRLYEFCEFYDAFAKLKSLQPIDREWLRSACDANQFVLASARHRGEPLVWHGYLVNAGTARLHVSASFFRSKEAADRAFTARANRWLHWRSMLSFRALGLQRYDWGGLFEDDYTPERAGINTFKKQFGGRRIRTFDCLVPKTPRGRLRLSIRRFGDGLRSARERVRLAIARLRPLPRRATELGRRSGQ